MMSYSRGMADTITIRTDDETELALDVLTQDGSSRSAAIRQAVLEAASRRARAAEMRRDVLRTNLGQPDGVDVAEELARDRADER
jgi:predicted transcriptional regulator